MSNQISSLLFGAASNEVPERERSFEPGSFGAPLRFDNIHNLRDLGGLCTRDGRRVRAGRLFRSGNPGMASAADIARLQRLGFDAVVDFRSPEEGAFAKTVNRVSLPILEGGMSLSEFAPRLRSATRHEMDDFMLQVYRDFPIWHAATLGKFMKEAETGRSVLYHCSTGKDRAGFATLLLTALDVAPDTILANYLESNEQNKRLINGLIYRLEQLGIEPEAAMPLLEVRSGYLQESLQTIEKGWGSTERNLGEALAIDVLRLREHYVD